MFEIKLRIERVNYNFMLYFVDICELDNRN
jgi:hypothetical protein